jgi:predicted ATP-grasp superfamily ATP-dependent carboligase
MYPSNVHPSRILVLDANQRSALAVVRSLGKHKNIQVFAADETIESLAGNSKYCHSYFQHPSLISEYSAFTQWLSEFVQSNAIDYVFPVTDLSSQSVLQINQKLGLCKIPFANYKTVLSIANKWYLIKLAEELHLVHPASQCFAESAEFEFHPSIKFPVVLKPNMSVIQLSKGWLRTAVHVVNSSYELKTLLTEKPYFRDHPFMMQEFIPGTGAGVFALYDNGKPIIFFAHRRLREKPPRGGVSVLSESITPEPRMLSITKKLLDSVAWHGVAMVEFRVTPEGEPYIMEANTRFWGSLQLAIDSGVDFPYLLYQICNKKLTSSVNYKLGCRLRWLLGDLDNLYLILSDQKFSRKKKLKAIWDFIVPHPLSTYHEINRWEDMSPAWYELKIYFKNLRG